MMMIKDGSVFELKNLVCSDYNGDNGDCNGDDAGLVVIMTVKRFQSEVGTFPLGFVLKFF